MIDAGPAGRSAYAANARRYFDDHYTAEKIYEGARSKNVYGSYLHGSLLPKNPAFADALLAPVLERIGVDINEHQLDDSLAEKAREVMFKRLGVK